MNDNNNLYYEQIQPLKAKLIEHFKKNDVSLVKDAANIAFYHFRAQNHKNAIIFKKALLCEAYKLKLPFTNLSINEFSMQVIDIAIRYQIFTIDNYFNDNQLKKNARSTITWLLNEGYPQNNVAQKAALILHKKRKKLHNSYINEEFLEKHPLKNILSLPSKEALAKEDIRYKLLHLKNSTHIKDNKNKLYQVLAKASAFCVSNIHKLLGDELFSLCRPLGFVDKNETLVLIEVVNSTILYKLTYRKLEIINLLKKDDAFSNAKNIKFVLKSEF